MTVAERIQERSAPDAVQAPVSLRRILVALDQSDYANQALAQAVRLAVSAGGKVAGIHVYAAKLHDRRFKQMEGGLPERYRREREMEHQREVHQDLIGMGLGLISDSYHDAAGAFCDAHSVAFERLSPEGKNYACIVAAAKSGAHDVLAIGALGLGAVPGSSIGTVCERVVRRSPIDVFVARDRHRAIGDGPIVVGMDGSAKSFGALKTALDIGRRLDVPVHVVAAYDPYFHYVAFNRIATVLDEEKGRVFRFKEQEKLHEELIDDGIAKIYDAHLNVARNMAESAGVEITSELLAGKPFQAIRKYLERQNASLLIVGMTGIHADAALDIGGTAENLLRSAPCHVWLSQAEAVPPSDVVADATIKWSDEAEAAINRAPGFVRGLARTAVIREAQKAMHTYITTRFVNEVMVRLMPGGSMSAGGNEAPRHFATLPWSPSAEALLARVADAAIRDNVRLRAAKSARRDAAEVVAAEHVTPFLPETGDEATTASPTAAGELSWSAASLARLARVPEAFRDQVRAAIEAKVRQIGASRIEGDVEEEGFKAVREAMCPAENAAPD